VRGTIRRVERRCQIFSVTSLNREIEDRFASSF
jgi:hypothetical protein